MELALLPSDKAARPLRHCVKIHERDGEVGNFADGLAPSSLTHVILTTPWLRAAVWFLLRVLPEQAANSRVIRKEHSH